MVNIVFDIEIKGKGVVKGVYFINAYNQVLTQKGKKGFRRASLSLKTTCMDRYGVEVKITNKIKILKAYDSNSGEDYTEEIGLELLSKGVNMKEFFEVDAVA